MTPERRAAETAINSGMDVASGADLESFVSACVKIARLDHTNARHHRSGKELVNRYCREWRGLSVRLASTVYNKTRETLSAQDRESMSQ